MCLRNSCPELSEGTAGTTFLNLVSHLLAAQCLITEPWPKDARCRIKDGDQFDFIIVGSGTAGSILANRLTQVDDWDVLLIEAGDDPPLESIIPNFFTNVQRGKQVYQYYTEQDKNSNRGCVDRRSFWPRGKMLGGTGSINALLYMRGTPEDYKAWHFNDDDGWDWFNINKYLKKSERMIDPVILNNSELKKNHGVDGEVIVEQFNTTHTVIVNMLTSAYMEMGLKYLSDLNGYTQMGVGKIRGNIYKGKRVSTATSILNVARDRKNLYILKNTFVNQIIFNKLKVTGVNVTKADGKYATFYVSKEVIISAGAINTPVLLMLSGIGPKNYLEKLNINVRVDLQVGKNLQDHVRIPILVTLNTGAKENDKSYWQKAAAQYLLDQTGPHALFFDQPNINAFISVPKDKKMPDVQIDHNYFVPNTSYVYSTCHRIMSYNKDICRQFKEINSKREMIIFLVSLCRPFSRGTIQLRSINPIDHPKIYSKYFSNERDMDIFVQNLKRITDIVNTDTFKTVGAKLERIYFKDCDDFDFTSDKYWECMARTLTFNVYHPVGTAKMGKTSDRTAVVDNKLKVLGIEGLRVVDASIMPTITSANTNAPVMMIAERAADFIKSDYDYEDITCEW